MAVGSAGFSLALCGSLGLGASLGLDKFPVRRTLGSPVAQTPEKSGLPSASRGGGADMFTVPSAFRGTPAVGYLNHWAARGFDAKAVPRMTIVTVRFERREGNRYGIGLRIHQCIQS